MAELLIDCQSCDIDAVLPSTGQTALLMVVSMCNVNLLNRLLARGADPNVRDKQGNTGLLVALRVRGAIRCCCLSPASFVSDFPWSIKMLPCAMQLLRLLSQAARRRRSANAWPSH